MIAIIDSGGANIASVRFALERLGVESVLTADPAVISAAERVILPGVGAAPVAMEKLARAGLVECIRGLTQPVLGICLGMQLLFERSEEGDTPLLGLIGGICGAFDPDIGLTVPHMGWNTLNMRARHAVFDGLDGADFYFVHGYAARAENQAEIVAETDYGGPVVASLARGNMVGTQFHPEKSQAAGLRLIENFVNWRP